MTTQTKQIVEEIHASFYGASNRILQKAKDLINDESVDEHAAMKHRLGFTQAKGVKEYLTKDDRKATAKALMNQVLYYQSQYPWFKVVTEHQVTKICEKYGLVFAPADRYKGEIPRKNLLEIQKFDESKSRIKPEDNRYTHDTFPGQEEISIKKYKREMKDRHDHSSKEYYHHVTNYFICAPISDIDTKGMRLNGTKLEPVPDPIVLFPLRGGFYAIVTAWGPESVDEQVINHKMN